MTSGALNVFGSSAAAIRSQTSFDGTTDVVIYPAGAFVPASTGEPFPDRYVTTKVTGGAAGDLTLTGILTTDELESVIRLNRDGTAANIDISDITDEFTITAANTINNTGGTNTTGDSLLIRYHRMGYDLTGLAFSNLVSEKAAMPLFAPAAWPSVNIGVMGLASAFGSGTVRFKDAGSTTEVDIEVAAFFRGTVFSNVEFSAVGAGPIGSSYQLPLVRLPLHANDDLAERFCVLAVYLTPGA